ncbi:MAG: FeoB-associated Cys-rich membrane protein [Ruminococcus sp.]|uniref:FeoB-associated Cys-rich membrane protein n=1 Tax=Ruminococcus sp. TaxID=41978 RepID=UPI0025D0C8C1|nr:FeoB-associated Cys-rich membrane protein [Ruminococcus sp.]MCR5600945.1 FeoB-associated Cys-rich membrane protein [Ruminococcus sp.]
MIAWLTANLGTITVSLVLIAIVSLIIAKMIKDKKSGKSTGGCGCSCEHCAMHGKCHK